MLRKGIRLLRMVLNNMADGVRPSSKITRGLYVQMHNASSSDLLWGGKSTKKSKPKASSCFFPVERLVSKRTSGGTVSVFEAF